MDMKSLYISDRLLVTCNSRYGLAWLPFEAWGNHNNKQWVISEAITGEQHEW